ncbi:hypothetical protein Q9R19_04595 [Microbacterium sp. ARD32]|uniref:hypothetical protein n=1 Tax=Microbacterium sp. ARD32 TaxID=2962577 RepID=UPI0028821DC7|nr:hypothetical protein [Microbacterium sp. ARD32]MDT0156903.1 hypothetical protein [Microbacterium sp. ARD32]
MLRITAAAVLAVALAGCTATAPEDGARSADPAAAQGARAGIGGEALRVAFPGLYLDDGSYSERADNGIISVYSSQSCDALREQLAAGEYAFVDELTASGDFDFVLMFAGLYRFEILAHGYQAVKAVLTPWMQGCTATLEPGAAGEIAASGGGIELKGEGYSVPSICGIDEGGLSIGVVAATDGGGMILTVLLPSDEPGEQIPVQLSSTMNLVIHAPQPPLRAFSGWLALAADGASLDLGDDPPAGTTIAQLSRPDEDDPAPLGTASLERSENGAVRGVVTIDAPIEAGSGAGGRMSVTFPYACAAVLVDEGD